MLHQKSLGALFRAPLQLSVFTLLLVFFFPAVPEPIDLIRILTVELELACNRGSCEEIYLHLIRFPRISLDCRLVPVQP